MKKLLALGLIALVVWNAVRTPDGAEYFVADKESRLYSMKVAVAGHVVEANASVTHEGTAHIAGQEYQEYSLTASGLPGKLNRKSYSRLAKDGIYMRSEKSSSSIEFLALPFPPKVGRKWRSRYDDTVVEKEIMGYEQLSIGGKTYQRCLKVGTRGQHQGVPIEFIAYYAPNVGLVKESGTFWLGKIEMELKE